MPRRKNKNKIISDMNVVPYIDVMLVLLIIFMATAPMITQGVNVDLPNSESTDIKIDDKKEPYIITIGKSGLYYIGADKIDKNTKIEDIIFDIKAIEKIEGDMGQILIRGDKSVNYGKVVGLMSKLKSSNVRNVGLITKDE
jgi:biopolymer transport protein TolR